VAPVVVGKQSFIGNMAVMPSGAQMGDHCLIGVTSTTPRQVR
jgi:carbonic anhydrase/acetyltransferase-like protein (isoleucine patch superfamily)